MPLLIKALLISCIYINLSFAQISGNDTILTSLSTGRIIKLSSLPVSFKPEINIDPLKREINYWVLGGVSTALVSTAIAVHMYQANAWWSKNRVNFHFVNDWAYARWIDKVGHFYGTTVIQHLFSSGLAAAEFSESDRVYYSSALALGFQTFVEIEDGYGPDWGFSPGDFLFDVLGAALPVASYYYPELKNYRFKFSYYPADLNKKDPRTGQEHIIIDDYAGQKFWLTFDMARLYPEVFDKSWLRYINFALGYGVRDLDGAGGGKSDFYLALDFNTNELPLSGRFGAFIKNCLNYLHLPMPGIRINNNVQFFVLCY